MTTAELVPCFYNFFIVGNSSLNSLFRLFSSISLKLDTLVMLIASEEDDELEEDERDLLLCLELLLYFELLLLLYL